MIATAFNRYQDLKLVCNDAHFARYLLLEAAIASFGFIACLLLKVAFTSSGFAAFLRLTAALAGSGLVGLGFAAYLSLIPLCLFRVSCVPGPRDSIMLCFTTGSLTASCYTVSL